TVEAFFRQISPLMPGIQGFAMRHCRLLGQLFFKLAASTPTIEAMLRTTIAMTRLSGSPADNVLPSQVSAIINLRLLWPWTVKRATDFIEKAINDKRVTVSTFGLGTDPVPSHGNFRQNGWRQMESALNEAWPGIAMFPFIMIATTDSRHFQNLSESIFRFNPYILDPHEMEGIHGHNERISEENLRHGLMFYTALMRSI
ncbi:MAG: M20/M25/M40 family metallo-hydrolase, partial [Treponema sp.]|nr:M20/M25/M40 family metallo-hydrolase [Treponema sp.]